MISFLDNGQDLNQCEIEIGGAVGQLLTPLTRYRLREPSRPWAIDNGGFKKLDIDGLFSLMAREQSNIACCKFVSVPDVICSAQRTLELFAHFKPKMAGWPLAFVCQDGQENLAIPWTEIDAIFIGGSTSWKCSTHVEQIIKTAQILDKWVHIGRVNHADRFSFFEELGADSCDGTGIARYTHMRRSIADRHSQQKLFR